MKTQRYIQVVADAIIPLLGYFVWGWNIYFIVLFYLLDYLSGEIIVNLKAKQVDLFTDRGRSTWSKYSKVSVLLFILTLVSVHLGVHGIRPELHYLEELSKFFWYKELGIPQGFVLIPLVFFVAHQRYKMEFLIPAKFKGASQTKLWKWRMVSHGIVSLVGVLIFLLSGMFQLPEQVYLFLFVSGTALFNLMDSNS